MKEKIFNNLSLKVLSVLCAIVLWAIIVNIYDPTTSVTISNVNVQLINTESLTDKDYTYEVLDGNKISVYLSGPKSVITDIKASDIVATADLSKITAFADYVDISVKVVKDGRVINNIEIAPRTTAVKLGIENRVTKEFTVNAETTGSVGNGYVLTKKSISPETVRITGPASAVERIDQVRAVYDVSGITSNTTALVPLTIYDAQGEAFSNDNLVMSRNEVEFDVTVGVTKTVSITYEEITGTPAKGYFVSDISLSSTEAVITGSTSVLEQTEAIVLPSDVVNISGVSSDVAADIKLSDYLPSGLSIVSGNTVTVKVTISKMNEKKLSLSKDSIQIKGLADGMSAEIKSSAMSVNVSGENSKIEKLTAADITASIDLKSLSAGEHIVEVKLECASEIIIDGTYKVTVVIKSEETETAQEENTETGS